MATKEYDSEEAKAHIILLRDGLEGIDVIFKATKFLPDRYIKKYRKMTSIEDIAQIAYTAHILAIQTFPVNSTMNFFGWAGQTIRREIVDFVRLQKKAKIASERAAKSGESFISTCEHPEDSYIRLECLRKINGALNRIGKSNKRVVIDKYFFDNEASNQESYFKRQKRITSSLDRLKSDVILRDFL